MTEGALNDSSNTLNLRPWHTPPLSSVLDEVGTLRLKLVDALPVMIHTDLGRRFWVWTQ